MATDVIAFPPVGAVGSMWTVAAPVQRSRSMITGRRHVSRWGRERRAAMVNVSALSKNRSGAGYSEMLIRYLDGGANLVRLNSAPVNWHLDHELLAGLRSSQRVLWTESGDPLAWQDSGDPLIWFEGRILPGVVAGSQITVSGLPAKTLICRPGDLVEVFGVATDASGAISQAVTETVSDADGVAVIALFDALAAGSYPRVSIGASESLVFEVEDMPRSPQPLGQNWTYQWNFREVFADEVGGFTEVNPW